MSKPKCYLFIFIILQIFFSEISLANEANETVQQHSYTIMDAYMHSHKVYKAKKDIQKAIDILERSGIKAILKNKPSDIPTDQYIIILNDYAFYLTETDNRHEEAIPILQNVINMFPKRHVAYLNLGDAYLKLFKAKRNSELKETAKEYYLKYIEILRENKKRVLLPDTVLSTIYSDNKSVCEGISDFLKEGKEKDLELFLNPEKIIDNYCKNCKDKNKIAALEDSWLDSSLSYTVSEIDLDNDGKDELRLYKVVGSASCERNYFFKQDDDGKYRFIKNEQLEIFREEGAMCGDEMLSFLRYKNINYIVNKIGFPPKELIISEYQNNNLKKICTLSVSYNSLKAFTDCKEPICSNVYKKTNDILMKIVPWKVISGIEERVYEKNKYKIDISSLNISYIDIGEMNWYLIDIDNDGLAELLLKNKGGRGSWLYFIILKSVNGIYKPIDHKKIWKNFDLIGDYFVQEEDFIFEKIEGKNYLITIKRGPDFLKNKAYRLDIFLIQENSVLKVGTISTQYGRSVSIYKK